MMIVDSVLMAMAVVVDVCWIVAVSVCLRSKQLTKPRLTREHMTCLGMFLDNIASFIGCFFYFLLDNINVTGLVLRHQATKSVHKNGRLFHEATNEMPLSRLSRRGNFMSVS